MSLRTDRVRIIGSVKRKEGVSKEEFENFWINEHPKLFNSLEVVKRNILKYEQAHANEVVSQALTESSLTVAPFDAMSIFEAPTFEALMEVFTSEEYKKTVGAESLKYFERGQMFAANFATIIDN
ncbi:hypothetical protein PISMIDRAFT_442493 [Pisolithus microcarpus 441]|uniref:Unplaced genomic scaffold scaffold_4, whole genome shotgun sequence n=1 Tax=Pisolithus microcarpus 441 TaxID=765257 RepID=A0A0C9ZKD5_9AGAM|nr:hypothetical protein BKA83DRAFT_442493 [Pisolithus microcarpus]KIK29811.1 hypothetical protein PISMIDRAFT_442493 [Pisolithus microcarpus 441]